MIHKHIINRRSTVLFSKEEISTEVLTELFTAAGMAPSSLNIQPWRFVYTLRGEQEHTELLNCLNPPNQEWAKHAPVLIAVVAQMISDYKNRPNKYAWHDTAMAYSNLVFQATSVGLSLHPMAGFDPQKTITTLSIPENYEPVIIAALGKKSNGNDFPENLLERERTRKPRKPITEIVFYGKFNHSTNL